MKKADVLRLLALPSVILVLSQVPTLGDTITLESYFNATFNGTNAAPYIGSGTLSYDAPSALPDGVYAWDSLSNVQLSLTLNATTFTQGNLTTSSSQVYVGIQQGYFFFENIDGGGNGGYGGAADFVNGGYYLSTEPYQVGGQPSAGGCVYSPLYLANVNSGTLQGTYGMPVLSVPEPAPDSFVALGLATLILCRRRKLA